MLSYFDHPVNIHLGGVFVLTPREKLVRLLARMPIRLIPFVTGEYYHLFNRGVNKQAIFQGTRDYKRALDVFEYYSFSNTGLRFSKYLQLSPEDRNKFLDALREKKKRLVEFICFCLMPNHFHFLVKQQEENGISRFMSNFENSYTKYFNTKYDRIGPLLQGQFKAVHVEDDNQFIHLTRYIHLNPYTSFIVKTFDDLERYPWSSFQEYLGKMPREQICMKDNVLASFKTIKAYKVFVFDQADYQRELDQIKHLTLES